MTDPTIWVKASRSSGAGQCVEMRRVGALVEMRDSKQGDEGPILVFTLAEMAAWLDGAKHGEFDHLA